MICLSCFDGMSCGQIAFERAGISIEKYYASEIDKYAITVTQKNYPNTIQLGSITDWKSWNIETPDIIIGGSPCQGFSFAGKQLNFKDERSKLFFTFLEILKHYKKINPKILFLLENVVMKKEYNDVISSMLGELFPECIEQQELFRAGRLEPIQINSALVSAQNRERLYWTNIQGIQQPKDKGILLKDIIENATADKDKSYCLDANYWKGCSKEYSDLKGRRQMVYGGAFRGRTISDMDLIPIRQKSKCLRSGGRGSDPESKQEWDNIGCIQIGTADINGNESIKRIYSPEGKSLTLTAIQGGNQEPKIITHSLQPRNGKGKGGKGHLQKSDGKSYCLYTANGQAIETDIQWRKLTPLECERLQTVDDGYTEGVSNSQRYRMLGNGWTVDIIAHIFGYIKCSTI